MVSKSSFLFFFQNEFFSRKKGFLLGLQNREYTTGFQTEISEFPRADQESEDWSLAQQFLGNPTRARLTSFMTVHYLDVYFP